MSKLWAGRTSGEVSSIADDFNSSIRFDCKLYKQDITGSMAHAAMLGAQGIISQAEAGQLIDGLQGILSDLESGALEFDFGCEDIHMFVEQVLTQRLGDVGKKLHTARSRNDQVALDLRMYLKDQIDEITALVKDVLGAIVAQAENNKGVIMPGYTHLQRAQPILFSHHLMAYAMMLLRDLGRLGDCRKRMNVCPIGSCALAGTTYPTDRRFEARRLGIMPQKKNPDMAELVRGKTGRVYGDLMGLLTTLKGLPLAYNKDMQEDKEAVFDAVDTVKMCLKVFAPMLSTMTVKPETMKKAAQGGFINATDLADYLVKKGMPFRSAYKISGQIVARCIVDGCVLETLPLETYRSYSELFDEDLYREIDLAVCVEKRISEGGTSAASVDAQIAYVKEQLGGGNV